MEAVLDSTRLESGLVGPREAGIQVSSLNDGNRRVLTRQ
jgi:hypothetical protein